MIPITGPAFSWDGIFFSCYLRCKDVICKPWLAVGC